MTSSELVIERMSTRELRFDTQNPRLRGEEDDDLTQQQIFDTLWRDYAVSEVAASIAANGFFDYEPLFVASEHGQLVVVEGNRRLAAVKALVGEHKPPAGPLPRLTVRDREELETLPAMRASRTDLWQYIGFKHVNGPQAWRSASKAAYIAWVHNDVGIPLDEIARRIGDQHSTVQRFYRALMVIEQAETADVWQRTDRYKEHFSFSHLYTGLDYSGIQDFVKVKSTTSESKEPVPKTRLKELGELCLWLYGSRSRNRPPAVQSQNPDLRILDDVLRSENGIAALRRGLPLRVSQDISKGDPRLLREALVGAKESLQTARGRVLTGYNGENDLRTLASDIQELADAIVDDLAKARTRGRGRTQSTV